MLELLKALFNPMSIQVGGIDLAQQSLANEFLIALIDKYLDWIIENNKLKKPTQDQIEEMRKSIIADLQKKYPDAGITLKK